MVIITDLDILNMLAKGHLRETGMSLDLVIRVEDGKIRFYAKQLFRTLSDSEWVFYASSLNQQEENLIQTLQNPRKPL